MSPLQLKVSLLEVSFIESCNLYVIFNNSNSDARIPVTFLNTFRTSLLIQLNSAMKTITSSSHLDILSNNYSYYRPNVSTRKWSRHRAFVNTAYKHYLHCSINVVHKICIRSAFGPESCRLISVNVSANTAGEKTRKPICCINTDRQTLGILLKILSFVYTAHLIVFKVGRTNLRV